MEAREAGDGVLDAAGAQPLALWNGTEWIDQAVLVERKAATTVADHNVVAGSILVQAAGSASRRTVLEPLGGRRGASASPDLDSGGVGPRAHERPEALAVWSNVVEVHASATVLVRGSRPLQPRPADASFGALTVVRPAVGDGTLDRARAHQIERLVMGQARWARSVLRTPRKQGGGNAELRLQTERNKPPFTEG